MFKGLTIIFILSFVSVLSGQDKMLEENLKRHIEILSLQIGERNVFRYENLEKTANYIKKELQSFGYSVEEQVYFIDKMPYRNIIANKNSEGQKAIVVCAHYDSVFGSPGADDNASGIAGLLELARLLAKDKLNKTIKFIAFVNEEPPFFATKDMGSFHYAKRAKKEGLKIEAILCLESIGFYSEKEDSQSYPPGLSLFYPNRADFIAFVSNLSSQRLLKRVVKELKKASNFPLEYLIAPLSLVPAIAFSDNWSFWKFGYKAVMITDTAFYRNPYYHSGLDLPHTLDYTRLSKLVEGLYNVLLSLGKENINE
ncbi:MAG: M20/M25/M40 family metallo-hydrolase [Candidatus Omnitrophica bacterium]|nr:M20/M25/M40 family metallo-hydrolase [Candidatus Omnitrophota bacterium]